MIDRVIDRVLDFLFPALARRDRVICRMIERKRASRASRDEATAEMRQGTTRLMKTLCAERDRYVANGKGPGIVVMDRGGA